MQSREMTQITLETGLTLTLRRVEPGFLQKIMRSVPSPKRPTYRTRTATGREEEFPLDEISARERPEDAMRWKAYKDDYELANMERSEKVANALYIFGIEPFDLPDNGWEQKYELVGVSVPVNPEMRRAFYIASEATVEEQTKIVQEISRLSGVSQEAIAEAEDTFRR